MSKQKIAWRKGQGSTNIIPALIVEYYGGIKILYVEFRFLKFFGYRSFCFKTLKSN